MGVRTSMSSLVVHKIERPRVSSLIYIQRSAGSEEYPPDRRVRFIPVLYIHPEDCVLYILWTNRP